MSTLGHTVRPPLPSGTNDPASSGGWAALRDARLAALVESWRPHVVHTLGLFHAGLCWYSLHDRLSHRPRWVLQLRGGSDLQVNHRAPVKQRVIRDAACAADQIVSDNLDNFRILRDLGVDERAFAPISPVPGTGGMDVPAAPDWAAPPSQRNVIFCPKAHVPQFAHAYPVIEALRRAADGLPSCRIVMLWADDPEVVGWFEALPPSLRAMCDLRGRLRRSEVLALMREARVLLAPSLVDGRPNVMFEAMVAGAFPIVSPLATIREIVDEPDNVLFARNFHPEEIAAALLRAMRDDDLVDGAAARNLELVRRVADRAEIRERVIAFYRRLAAAGTGLAPPDASPSPP